MLVRYNAIFAVLTALILALGFYGADIIGHFISHDTAESAVIPRDRSQTDAVYLTEDKKPFTPMSIVAKTAESVNSRENPEIRDLATAIIVAISEQNEKTAISEPVAQPLRNSLKFSRNGYIYVENWQYLDLAKKPRCLDCIIWTEDLSISYIRFYSDEDIKLTGKEMNDGLDRLDSFSNAFYPKTSDFIWAIDDVRNELHEKPEGNYQDFESMIDYIDIQQGIEPAAAGSMMVEKFGVYTNAVHSFCGAPDNLLVRYWIPQLAFNDVFTSKGQMVVGGTKIVNIFYNLSGIWVKPSYSAENGIIYQTVRAGKNDLTILYNVRDDMIEGFYFPAGSDLDQFGFPKYE